VLTGLVGAFAILRGSFAVLLRDLPRRALWRGVAILSLCRRRRRQRGVSSQGRVVGGWPAACSPGCSAAAGAVDHGYLAAHLSVQFCGAGSGCAIAMAVLVGVDAPSPRRQIFTAATAGRNRAAAAVHRGGVLRHRSPIP